MRSYYSLSNFKAFTTLMTVLLKVVTDDHFDLTLFGHYCKVLSERLAVVMAMKADILSTSQDGDAEGAALKAAEMRVISKLATDVTIALRKVLLHRILHVFSARDTFEFILQTYCRLKGVDRATGLNVKAREAWQLVRVHLGSLYGLDISDTTFPAYGICGEKMPLFRVEDKYGLTCPITMFGHILTDAKDRNDYMDLEESFEHKCAVSNQSTGPEVDQTGCDDTNSQGGAVDVATAFDGEHK